MRINPNSFCNRLIDRLLSILTKYNPSLVQADWNSTTTLSPLPILGYIESPTTLTAQILSCSGNQSLGNFRYRSILWEFSNSPFPENSWRLYSGTLRKPQDWAWDAGGVFSSPSVKNLFKILTSWPFSLSNFLNWNCFRVPRFFLWLRLLGDSPISLATSASEWIFRRSLIKSTSSTYSGFLCFLLDPMS